MTRKTDGTLMHRLGWIRRSKRFAARDQRAALNKFGVPDKNIYEEGPQKWADLLRATRTGNAIVVDGVHNLGSGNTRPELLASLADLSKRGAHCVDAESGESFTAKAGELLADAFRIRAGEVRVPDHKTAVERGKMGGGKPKVTALSRRAMKAIWLDKAIGTNAEAAQQCGLSVRTLYRLFGSPGRPSGWQRK